MMHIIIGVLYLSRFLLDNKVYGTESTSPLNATGCKAVPEISNGRVQLNDQFNTSEGAMAYVLCDTGWEAVMEYIICLENGLWEDWETFAECVPVDCGPLPAVENGVVTLREKINTTYRALADVTCTQGYKTNVTNITCLENGSWKNVTCERSDFQCSADNLPSITNGKLLLDKLNQTTFSVANISCDPGYIATAPEISCLENNTWQNNATCAPDFKCEINDLPFILNGEIVLHGANQTYAEVANISCDPGFAANVPQIRCLEKGIWQDNATCVPYDLGIVRIEIGQEVTRENHTAFLKCNFSISVGLIYKIRWYVNDLEVYNTGLFSSRSNESTKLLDDFISKISLPYQDTAPFGLQISCIASVYDGFGETELQNVTSDTFVPIEVTPTYITMTRGQQATISVILNIPFGCPIGSPECFLYFILYDPDDSYNCYDSSIAVVHSDTCGGKIGAITDTSSNHVINITITTKNNRWYWLRSYFRMKLQLNSVGNSKSIWNSPSTTIVVRVEENYYTRYRGCYSFVDPYMYTFDRRFYSNQLVEEFVMLKHKTLPVEVQTITAPCNNGRATCSCAVTVRAGADVFTINHCGSHLTDYLSARDGILRVYRLWTTYYMIVLPNGMEVYVYIMPYFEYMMNVYVIPSPSDFNEMDGLCGNFNGDTDDDTRLRGTQTLSKAELSRFSWWYSWNWWSDYFFPHDFAYSWGLVKTKREEESLLNPDVYRNVESWNMNKKLCVCPYAKTGDFRTLCSAREEATCTNEVWRWGTLVEPSRSRHKRDTSRTEELERSLANRLDKMKAKWKQSIQEHSRSKRDVDNSTAISLDEAKEMCTEALSNCNAYKKKDDVQDVAESNDTLNNCARDVAIDGTTRWVLPHCDAYTQKVTVQLEKDTEFAKNHTDIVKEIVDNSCPGNCSGHGSCINKTCVCDADFRTDLCLVNITEPPTLVDIADDGICDVSNGSTCDYILVVGDGFLEDASCNVTIFGAGTDGKFYKKYNFNISCVYLNYNEIFAPTLDGNHTRRRREVTNSTTEIAKMIAVSVSNNGVNYGAARAVVVLDTTCQQTSINPDNSTVVILKTGFCYIAGVCYKEDSVFGGSTCMKCVPDVDAFFWTNTCDDPGKKNDQIMIISSSVGGSVAVVCILIVIGVLVWKNKHDKRKITPLVDIQLGPSKVKFWYHQDHDHVIDTTVNNLETKTGATEYDF